MLKKLLNRKKEKNLYMIYNINNKIYLKLKNKLNNKWKVYKNKM